MKKLFSQNFRYKLPVLFALIVLVVLLLIPTGYEDAVIYKGTDRCAAKIVKVNNDKIISTGLIRSGEQTCIVEPLGGRFKGQQLDGYNMLNGSLESDKIFKQGDTALVVISYKGDQAVSVNLIDHYRMNKELILAAIFVVLLIAFAGWTGVRAILSFAVTVLMIWKILIPFYLQGYNPVLVGILVTVLLLLLIIALVYGLDRRWVSAASGALLGVLATCAIGVAFTTLFQIHGAVMASSESLLYSGYNHLNLTQIFMASIFIGSSGAVMDLAVDITSSVAEVVQKKPDISWKEATLSGLRVGRFAMGTMTTTLLLAYSGGYIALLMVFMAQGTPVSNILNYKYVSAEILDTLVGSIGLVTVAPFTALTSGLLLTKKKACGINQPNQDQC